MSEILRGERAGATEKSWMTSGVAPSYEAFFGKVADLLADDVIAPLRSI